MHRFPSFSKTISLLALVAASLLAFPAAATAQNMGREYLARFEKEITVKVLPNGLTLIICERPRGAGLQLHHIH